MMAEDDIALAYELQARIGAGSLSEVVRDAIRAQHRKTKRPLVPRAGKGAPQDPSKQSITLMMGTATFERLGSSDKERAKTVNAALKVFFAQRPAEATAE
jgi:hypothetical protein